MKNLSKKEKHDLGQAWHDIKSIHEKLRQEIPITSEDLDYFENAIQEIERVLARYQIVSRI